MPLVVGRRPRMLRDLVELLPPRLPSGLNLVWQMIHPTSQWERCAKRYGDGFAMRYLGIGAWVHFWRREHLKQIFAADPAHLEARQGNELIEPIVGEHSIFLADGARHLRLRRLILPPLHGERLHAHLEVMRDITARSLQDWPIGTPFTLRLAMKAITLKVILRTIFGLQESTKLERFTADLTELLEIAGSPYLLVTPALIRSAPFGPWRRFRQLSERIDAFILAEIAQRRGASDGEAHVDSLSELVRARDDEGGAMGDDELRDQLMSLMFAGHETTELALTWTFQLVLGAADVAQELQAELATAQTADGLDLRRLMELEYLDAVIKESLRLWPVVPLLGRRVNSPYEISDRRLPNGTNVLAMIYLAHRDERRYDQPHRFRPERFLGQRIDPLDWLPFGGGDRRCAGMQFALAEMKVVIGTVLTGADLRLAPGPRGRAQRRGVLLAPSDRTRFIVNSIRAPA
jgi:cytochrome P450